MASSKSDDQRAMTSMRVFREFIKRTQHADGTESIDARDVISRECYDLWVKTRKILPPNPEKAFQRSLSAHVTGVDGRVPFTPNEEEAVLKVLRRKERWPCFEASSTRFGLMGFRAKGFHEKTEPSDSSPTSDLARKRNKHDDEYSDYDSGGSLPSATNQQQQFMTVAGNLLSLAHSTKKDELGGPTYLQNMPPLTSVDGSLSFLETAGALLNRSHVAGADAWGTVLSIGRMMLVSKGWSKPPVMEDAHKLLKDYCARYPTAHVVILDPIARQMKDRVMALSPSAQVFLGPIARSQSGLERQIIPMTDGWGVLTATFAAFKNPGVEFVANINVSCVDGVIRPVMASFCMFPNERLLAVRGVPLA